MAGSDRLALDPTASGGDPVQRLMTRVSELERQVSVLRIPSITPPKAATFNFVKTVDNGAEHGITYTASGGYCVVVASGIVVNPGGGSSTVTNFTLTVDGVARATGQLQVYDSGAGSTDATPAMMYAAGRWSGDHSIVLSNDVAGPGGIYGWQSAYILVIEQPFSG